MSILIKGMEMPKDDTKVVLIFSDGNVRVWGEDIDTDEWKKAVEVPTPHSRLVDCDEVFQRLQRFSISHPEFQEKTDSDFCALVRWLVTAPTIIEAEVEHE